MVLPLSAAWEDLGKTWRSSQGLPVSLSGIFRLRL
jgi:hypothetical protein